MQELNRCWLGFPVPTELRTKLAEVQVAIKRRAGGDNARWTAAHEFSIYLVSVGEVSTLTISKLQAVVGQVVVRHKPISLRLEGAGGSPNIVMPKSAWVGISGQTDALGKLQQDLAICVKPLVQAIDDKPFEPVVEIGVLRKFEEKARTDLGRAIKMSGTGVLGEFTLGAVHLLVSRSTPTGLVLQSAAEFAMPS